MNFKRPFPLLAATFLLAVTPLARAQMIGINFEGADAVSMDSGDIAGQLAQDNWNNAVPSSGTLSSLVDSTGATVTGLSLAYTSQYNTGGTASGSTGFAKLLAG